MLADRNIKEHTLESIASIVVAVLLEFLDDFIGECWRHLGDHFQEGLRCDTVILSFNVFSLKGNLSDLLK